MNALHSPENVIGTKPNYGVVGNENRYIYTRNWEGHLFSLGTGEKGSYLLWKLTMGSYFQYELSNDSFLHYMRPSPICDPRLVNFRLRLPNPAEIGSLLCEVQTVLCIF